jgi:hypothetical protein
MNTFNIDTFTLMITSPGYDDKLYYIFGHAENTEIDIPSIRMNSKSQELEEVVIYANKNYLQSNYSAGNQWFMGAIKIDSATAQTFYPPVNGSYAVEYTNSKGCKAISDVYDFRYYSLASTNYSNQFKVYPNPSSGILMFENQSNDVLTIQVIASDGKLVYTNKNLQKGLSEINLEHLGSGIFTVLLSGQSGRASVLVSLIK